MSQVQNPLLNVCGLFNLEQAKVGVIDRCQNIENLINSQNCLSTIPAEQKVTNNLFWHFLIQDPNFSICKGHYNQFLNLFMTSNETSIPAVDMMKQIFKTQKSLVTKMSNPQTQSWEFLLYTTLLSLCQQKEEEDQNKIQFSNSAREFIAFERSKAYEPNQLAAAAICLKSVGKNLYRSDMPLVHQSSTITTTTTTTSSTTTSTLQKPTLQKRKLESEQTVFVERPSAPKKQKQTNHDSDSENSSSSSQSSDSDSSLEDDNHRDRQQQRQVKNDFKNESDSSKNSDFQELPPRQSTSSTNRSNSQNQQNLEMLNKLAKKQSRNETSLVELQAAQLRLIGFLERFTNSIQEFSHQFNQIPVRYGLLTKEDEEQEQTNKKTQKKSSSKQTTSKTKT